MQNTRVVNTRVVTCAMFNCSNPFIWDSSERVRESPARTPDSAGSWPHPSDSGRPREAVFGPLWERTKERHYKALADTQHWVMKDNSASSKSTSAEIEAIEMGLGLASLSLSGRKEESSAICKEAEINGSAQANFVLTDTDYEGGERGEAGLSNWEVRPEQIGDPKMATRANSMSRIIFVSSWADMRRQSL